MAKRLVDPALRRIEIGIAVLFLLTAFTSITGELLFLSPVLSAPDLLASVLTNRMGVVVGAILWSVNNIGIVFIAVFAYPLLARRSQTIAIGYLVTRIIEGTVMMMGIGALLALVFLSQLTQDAGPSAEILKQLKVLGISQLSLPLLGLGGLMFTLHLVQHRLVPRAIAWTGVAGYALVLVGGMVTWFGGLEASAGGASSLLALPVAVFEIILLPGWLLFRGFTLPRNEGLTP